MQWRYNDGGRQAAGYIIGKSGDCATRSIAIITGKPYQEVYNGINAAAQLERKSKRKRGRSNANTGVYRNTAHRYITSLGYRWIPTMLIGSGCKVHLKKEELPLGRLIVCVSKHYTAVINGIIQDTHDCSRNETRCVYGYYIKEEPMECGKKGGANG